MSGTVGPAFALRRQVLLLSLGFVASRLLFARLGVSFDDKHLGSLWQVLDVELLRHDLLRSLLYMHGQPPLFNLFVGTVLKLVPHASALLFQMTYLAAGWAMAACVFLLLRAVGASAALSGAITALFSLSPGAIAYENWLFYPHLEAVLLSIAALALHRYVRDGNPWDGTLFFLASGGMVLLRSYFHLIWLLACLALALGARRERRRWMLALSTVPVLAAALWYGKTLYLYGSFTSSTWLGMSLARMTIQTVPPRQRKFLVREGVVSTLARVDSFQRLDAYRGLLPDLRKTGIPVLDNERKANTRVNLNHLAYIDLSRRYLRDSVRLIRFRPQVYWNGLRGAMEQYFKSVTDEPRLALVLAPLRRYNRFFDRWIYGRFEERCVFVAAGLPLLFIYALWTVRRELRRGEPGRPLAATTGFLALNVAYVTVLGNALDLGENNRFRFAIEPLLAILLGFAVHGVGAALRSRRHLTPSATPHESLSSADAGSEEPPGQRRYP